MNKEKCSYTKAHAEGWEDCITELDELFDKNLKSLPAEYRSEMISLVNNILDECTTKRKKGRAIIKDDEIMKHIEATFRCGMNRMFMFGVIGGMLLVCFIIDLVLRVKP